MSCVAGQVQRAMLTACPSFLAARKTVTPVFQAYEHSMENVCMRLCVRSQETMTVWGERRVGRGALLALPETAECMDTHTHIKCAEND